jgi:hypothetical protein
MKTPKEHKEQRAVLTWLRKRNYFVYAIPNHKEMRAYDGAVSGLPDLQISLEGGKVIWVEMKRTKGGRLSPKQVDIHAYLKSLGHIVILGFGAKDTIAKLGEHLELD